MATEGLPQGPQIKEHAQKAQPGMQAEMETKPEITRLPMQHGHDDVLTLVRPRALGLFDTNTRIAAVTHLIHGYPAIARC